jgi:hypothetical protein
VSDKRLFATMSEFAELFQKAARKENPLEQTIRKAYDNQTLRTRTKTNPMTASEAHISIIGHTTAIELEEYVTPKQIYGGTANRFLWVMARPRAPPSGRINLAR